MLKKFTHQSGFTLLELLLVIAVLAVIAAMSRDSFSSFLGGAGLKDSAQMIAYDLRSTRNQAMNGANDRNWGIHFVNGANDYYEIFSSSTDYSDVAKEITRTDYLKNNAAFSNPPEASSLDVIFSKISGTTTAVGIVLGLGQEQQIIAVNSQGLVN
jgi:prepilin-type N-terminal cleavage/methylation domain-containing protein